MPNGSDSADMTQNRERQEIDQSHDSATLVAPDGYVLRIAFCGAQHKSDGRDG
mgnify:CR=1 FL=1